MIGQLEFVDIIIAVNQINYFRSLGSILNLIGVFQYITGKIVVFFDHYNKVTFEIDTSSHLHLFHLLTLVFFYFLQNYVCQVMFS